MIACRVPTPGRYFVVFENLYEGDKRSGSNENNILLVLTALIWGCAFVAQSVGMDYVGPFTFNMARFLIGADRCCR